MKIWILQILSLLTVQVFCDLRPEPSSTGHKNDAGTTEQLTGQFQVSATAPLPQNTWRSSNLFGDGNRCPLSLSNFKMYLNVFLPYFLYYHSTCENTHININCPYVFKETLIMSTDENQNYRAYISSSASNSPDPPASPNGKRDTLTLNCNKRYFTLK